MLERILPPRVAINMAVYDVAKDYNGLRRVNPKQWTFNENQLVQDLSEGKCKTGSIRLMEKLCQSGRTFKHMFLLTTKADPSNPFDESLNVNNEQVDEHTFLIIHTKNDHWFAASPANHHNPMTNNSKRSHLFTIIHENSLTDLLEKIKGDSGGVWPTEEEIMPLLHDYKKPKYEKSMGKVYCLEITRNVGTIGHSVSKDYEYR